MRKLLFCSALIALLFTGSVLHAAVDLVLFDQTFTRATGAPVVDLRSFPGASGQATIYLWNGDAEDSAVERVSSSVITVNGATVFDASNFNQNTTSLNKNIVLSNGDNSISVLLKGKPGGKVRVKIVQQIKSDAAAIIGPEGGSVVFTKQTSELYGAKIDIPQGALSVPTVIAMSGRRTTAGMMAKEQLAIQLEPSGLQFSVPAQMTVPYNTLGLKYNERLTAAILSGEAFEAIQLSISDGNHVKVEIPHFSFVFFAPINDVYLVLDIPPKYLTKGDILYALTRDNFLGSAIDWFPGHAGMHLGEGYSLDNGTSYGERTLIESSPNVVRLSNWDKFVNLYEGNQRWHIYMGARRPNGITTNARVQAASFAVSKLNKDWNLTGGDDPDSSDFSCVGLVEAAYESAQLDIVNEDDSPLIPLMPVEQFNATNPIGEISVKAGDPIAFKVRGVINRSRSFDPCEDYSDDIDYYSVAVTNMPSGATFNNNVFSWTPGSHVVGHSFTVTFEVESTQGSTKGIKERQNLMIKVKESDSVDLLEAPILLSPSKGLIDVDHRNVNFTWRPNPVSTGHQAQYCLTIKQDSVPEDIPVYRGCDLGEFVSDMYFQATLSPGKKYWWAVWAKDSAGNWSPASEWWSFTTLPDTQAPSIPQNISAIPISSTQVNLAWQASTDNDRVSKYKIYVNGIYLFSSDTNSASNWNLTPATKYCYAISAVDATGIESGRSSPQVCAMTQAAPDTQAPSIPQNLSASPTSTTQIGLAWTASTDNVGVTGYKVYVNGSYLFSSDTNSASNWGLTPATQYCYAVSAIDAAGNESGRSSPQVCATTQGSLPPGGTLNDGLVAYYPFNGNANDESGNGHNGTTHGGSILTADRFNTPSNAYSFNSIDDYIDLGPENTLFSNPNFSVAMWIKAPRVSTYWTNFGIIGDYIEASTPFWYITMVDNGYPDAGPGKVYYGLRSNEPGSERALFSSSRLDDDKWHFLTIVRDAGAGKMHLYVDGVLDGTSDATRSSIWSGQNITVARTVPSAGRYSIFTGDDIRIYNRALSNAEIQELYNLKPGEINPGTAKWVYPVAGSVYSPAVGTDGTVYVGSNNYSLYALNPDGSRKWAYMAGGYVISSPAIGADGTIYVGSYDGNLHALNPNGSRKWAYKTGGAIYFSSPAIGADGTIYVGTSYGDHALYAINSDGMRGWSYPTGGEIWSSPAIGADGTIYVGSYDGNLYALNPDGSRKWAYTTGGGVISSPAIGADGTIYVGSNDYNLYSLNPDGSLKWAYTTGSALSSSPAIGADGTIYVGSGDGNLYALNPDGSRKWAYTTGSAVNGSPTIGADGTIYVGSGDGNLYALNPDGSRKWAYTTGDGIDSSPAMAADGTIYLGSGYNVHAISSSSSGLATSPWPMFHKNAQHTGR